MGTFLWFEKKTVHTRLLSLKTSFLEGKYFGVRKRGDFKVVNEETSKCTFLQSKVNRPRFEKFIHGWLLLEQVFQRVNILV